MKKKRFLDFYASLISKNEIKTKYFSYLSIKVRSFAFSNFFWKQGTCYLWVSSELIRYELRDEFGKYWWKVIKKWGFNFLVNELKLFHFIFQFRNKKKSKRKKQKQKNHKTFLRIWRFANADLKISVYVCVHIKTISWKFWILNPKNYRLTCPWSL